MATNALAAGPNPAIIWDHINAYQRSACLRGAVELNLFTKIGEGNQTVQELARACSASERGIRVLCDYLTIQGLLTKDDGRYGLTQDTAAFLDRRSRSYMGGVLGFLNSPELRSRFENIADVVRRGGPSGNASGVLVPDNPLWLEFARSMPAMMMPAAQFIAERAAGDGPRRVLDIAAGHGLFGISIAQRNPLARITAIDWAPVLEIAQENARNAGVEGRLNRLAGDALSVDFGGGYDVVLLTNFLHHFDGATNERLLGKIRAALAPGGSVYTLEMVPNPDGVTPPIPAAFNLNMLAGTSAGRAYTFQELKSMFDAAGFASSQLLVIPNSPQSLIVSA